MTGLGSAHRNDGEHDDRACSERVMSGRGIRSVSGTLSAQEYWRVRCVAMSDDALVVVINAAERELRRRKDRA